MIRALYTAASGMMVEGHRMDLMTSNLFYADTPGFKAAGMLRAGETAAGAPTDVQTAMSGEFFDSSQGPLRPTEKPLDLALEGEGFFAIQTKAGVAYTRDGRFRKGSDGLVKDGNGNALLGQDGPIRLPPGAAPDVPVVVRADGTVLVGQEAVGRLRLEAFPGFRGLRSAGGSLFFPTETGSPRAIEGRVIQGVLEGANTSGIVEITRSIETMRAFESYQKVIQTVDEVTGEAVRRIGRLA